MAPEDQNEAFVALMEEPQPHLEILDARAHDLELRIAEVLDGVAVGLNGSETRTIMLLGDKEIYVRFDPKTGEVALNYLTSDLGCCGFRRDQIKGRNGEYSVVTLRSGESAKDSIPLRDYLKSALTGIEGSDSNSHHDARVLREIKSIFGNIRSLAADVENRYRAFMEEPQAKPAEATVAQQTVE